MKKLIKSIILMLLVTLAFAAPKTPKHNANADSLNTSQKPMMSIVIDDFGSFDQSGVDILLNSSVPITAAVIPKTDNTKKNISQLEAAGKEIILHMPMESHVHLPESWYGNVYIRNFDSPEAACKKINDCRKEFPEIKGFNIHIGSGVSRNKTLMTAIYNYAKEHNLYFLDSRTIETKAIEEACKDTNSIYLGRDEFLEADKNKSYTNVVYRLNQGAKTAKEKGYAIVIGHVGAEGGTNTAKAILDTAKAIEEQGVEIVPLSKIYEYLKTAKTK